MLVKVKPGHGSITPEGYDWGPGTVHSVLCICPGRRHFKLVNAAPAITWLRSHFIEGDIDEVWLECVDDGGDAGAIHGLEKGHVYPCVDPVMWRQGGARIPLVANYTFVASRFIEVPYPRLEPKDDVWREMTAGAAYEPPYKAAMMAFFKKPQHDDLCASCGAPLPCRYHS